MKLTKTVFFSLSFFLAMGTLNADCLDAFHSANYAALQEYGNDMGRCDSNLMCENEAELSYSQNVGLAADEYSDCCDNGGGGCPPEE